MIVYESWNDMLNKRDELHTTYIRKWDHGNYWQLVCYSKWSADCYFAYVNGTYKTLDELLSAIQLQGYNTSRIDVCTYKEEGVVI